MGADSASAAHAVLDLRVRALGMLSRPDEAARIAAAYGHWLDPRGRSALTREVAWGYVRAGDVDRARAAVSAAGVDDRELDGWLALFGGDLRTARADLRAATAPSTDLVAALALLGRTRADSAPSVGRAFVALARADTAAAARAFAEAGDLVLDAAPLLLAEAARLHTARHEDAAAVPIWRQVVERYADAPEAAEADLEWGRALRRDRDLVGAEARWEHLILTYPLSALVPQARRELDAAHRLSPPASAQS
jgi:tetratricopeptide (TPR) repeat protein